MGPGAGRRGAGTRPISCAPGASVRDEVPTDCVVSFDNLHTVPRGSLRRRVTRLGAPRMAEACRALRDALGAELIVNYDLPWNPQRIEQRIGRCIATGRSAT